MRLNKVNILLCLTGLFLAGCASNEVNLSDSPYSQAAAIKGQGGSYKVGKPYKISGQWYYPKEDYIYSEVGIASWYGKDFHAKKTANGENYDMNTLTAAHRTLPLPSIVRVTNLENGRSLVLRVNDRGPYAKNRIIDISKRGAQLLGFQTQGTAKVRVDLLEDESKELKAALLNEPMPTRYDTPKKTTAYAANRISIPKRQIEVYKATGPAASAPVSYQASNTSTGKSYFVQAGAFSKQDTAHSLSRKLTQFGNARVAEADVDGKRFYRVRLGPFSFPEEAEVTLAKVRNYGIQNASVVRD